MHASPPYRMTSGPTVQEDRNRLAAALITWSQERPALQQHIRALITLLNQNTRILTLYADDQLIAALHLVHEPQLTAWEPSARAESSLLLCHLVRSPQAPAEEPVMRLVTLWATDFAARSGRQWVRGEIPLPPGSPVNGLLAAATETGWSHARTVEQTALMQCKAELRPRLNVFLRCEVAAISLLAVPPAARS